MLEFDSEKNLVRIRPAIPKFMKKEVLFTNREEHMATTFASATKGLTALADSNRSRPLTLVRDVGDEHLEIKVDSTVARVWRGVQNGSARELINDGLGQAVVDIFDAIKHNTMNGK